MVADGRAEARPRDDDSAPAAVRTAQDLLETWLGEVVESSGISDTTKANYKSKARLLIRTFEDGAGRPWSLGPVPLPRIDSGAMGTYRDAALRSGVVASVTSVDGNGVMRIAWAWGRRRKLVTGTIEPVRVKSRPVRDKYTPTEAEFWRVMDAMGEARTPSRGRPIPEWAMTACYLLNCTGARIGELATLTWGKVLSDQLKLLLGGKTLERETVVSAQVVERLAALRPADARDSDRVLADVTAGTVKRHLGPYIDRACEHAGVRRWTPHALRRYAIDRYYSNGVDVGVVAAQLGQSPGVALRYYRRPRDDQKQRAVALAGLGVRPGESS